MDIKGNLERVRGSIADAARRAGRDPASVRLVAVTKTVGPSEIMALVDAGQNTIAEGRPQAFRDKTRELAGKGIRWHFLGSLQTNKVKYVYPEAELVHSVDRPELVEEFAKWAGKTGRKCPFLLEVHISGEETKQGFSPEEILPFIESVRNRPDLDIRGLMGMAPFVEDQARIRSSFKLLRRLFDESRRLAGGAYDPVELSMGMTDDYPIAIEEGATLVRIGRALFLESAERSP